jgi:hypothetical protein
MREEEWRLYNEAAGANDRKCNVINYFQCPYGEERHSLTTDGSAAYALWQQVEWYDRHWNRPATEPQANDNKWYHFNGPPIINVESLDDILNALEDGRLDKIIQEHERYMKEKGREIWAP